MKAYKAKIKSWKLLLSLIWFCVFFSEKKHSSFDIVLTIAVVVLLIVTIFVRYTIGFIDDENCILIKDEFTSPELIYYNEIIGVDIVDNKIYVQTRSKNYTLSKKEFEEKDFDEIANEFLLKHKLNKT